MEKEKERLHNSTIKSAARFWTFSDENKTYCIKRFGHIKDWQTGGVTSFKEVFADLDTFNEDISKWDTSNATDMSHMFYGCTIFNQDISNWNTSKVTDMEKMFRNATTFNQNLSKWDTSNVTNMTNMFEGTYNFDHSKILKWDRRNVRYFPFFPFMEPESYKIGNNNNVAGYLFNHEFFNEISGLVKDKMTENNFIFKSKSDINFQVLNIVDRLSVRCDVICKNQIQMDYLREMLFEMSSEDGDNIYDVMFVCEVSNENVNENENENEENWIDHIVGFSIVQIGENKTHEHVPVLNIICAAKLENAISVGRLLLYCYILAIYQNRDHYKIGILELSGGPTNISAFCLYNKFGFRKDTELSSYDTYMMKVDLHNIDLEQLDNALLHGTAIGTVDPLCKKLNGGAKKSKFSKLNCKLTRKKKQYRRSTRKSIRTTKQKQKRKINRKQKRKKGTKRKLRKKLRRILTKSRKNM